MRDVCTPRGGLDPVEPSIAGGMVGGAVLQPRNSLLGEAFPVTVGARLPQSFVEWPPIHGVARESHHHAGAVSPRRAVNVNGLVLRVLDERKKLFGLTLRGDSRFVQRNPQDIRESVPGVIDIVFLAERDDAPYPLFT